MATLSPSSVTLTVQSPKSETCRALACTPLPRESKICYIAKKAWEYIGIAANAIVIWTARVILYTCQIVATGVGLLLTTPFAVLQIIFSAVFSRSRLQNYSVGNECAPLTPQLLDKSMQALSNRKKGVENLTFAHNGVGDIVCDESLFEHLMIIQPETLTFVNCTISAELERKMSAVLDLVKFEGKVTAETLVMQDTSVLKLAKAHPSENTVFFTKRPRQEKEILSITTQEELLKGLERIFENKVRLSELRIVNKNKGETIGLQLTSEQSEALRQKHLRTLILEGCWMNTDQEQHEETFATYQFSSVTLLKDLEDLRQVARLRNAR